jgi:predicted ATPase/DNA-binding XRE family transcriptional regulator
MVSSFAVQLRAARVAAELTQEQLAERARISISAVGAYERGARVAPHRDTVALLAEALRLTGSARSEFEAAARRKVSRNDPGRENASTDDLPLDTTHFVGRSVEVAQVAELLRRERIVTLTGPGGIGKTRIAIQVARQFAKSKQRVGLVNLASLTDERFVSAQVATTLGIPYSLDDRSPVELAERLRQSDALIVLDNCEHVIDAASGIVSAIARTCPRVRILSTSRERLKISGETVYRVPPLPTPTAATIGADEAMRFGAIELFVRRAMAAERTFQFGDACCNDVLAICRRLEGIPLAIELVAAQLPLLGLSGLLRQLDGQLPALGGGRDMPTRQQTLGATLDWSYRLLTASERALLRRLAPLVGSWTLEAAQFLSDEDSNHVRTLFGLLEKSLVSIDNSEADTRYRMLEVTRAFALEQSALCDEVEQNARRHAEWVAQEADRAYEDGAIVARDVWYETYAPNLDNVRAALSWCLGAGKDHSLAARIIAGYRLAWNYSGLQDELRKFAEDVLVEIDEEKHPRAAALLLLGVTSTLYGAGRITRGKHAARLFEAVNDAVGLATAWASIATGYRHIGDVQGWKESLDMELSLLRSGSLARSLKITIALQDHAQALFAMERFGESELEMKQALSLAEASGDPLLIGMSHLVLAELSFQKDDVEGAIQGASRSIESLSLSQAFASHLVVVLANRAGYYLAVDDVDHAARDATQALLEIRGFASRNVAYVGDSAAVWSIQVLAAVAARRRHPVRASRLLGWVEEQLRRNTALVRTKAEHLGYNRLAGWLREQLPESAIATQATRGALLSEADAIDLATDNVEVA